MCRADEIGQQCQILFGVIGQDDVRERFERSRRRKRPINDTIALFDLCEFLGRHVRNLAMRNRHKPL